MSGVVVLVGTRKGLFVARSDDRTTYEVEPIRFGMNAVASVGIDARRPTPRLFAAARSEHWGPSLFHSDDLGASWSEPSAAPIAFPERTGAALAQVWQVVPGPVDEPDVVYAGTEPSALFRSEDGGISFALVEGLWDHPHRPTWYPGFGGQCLHTVVPHPTDTDRVLVAMSTGGVYRTADGGASWHPSNTGVSRPHSPDPYPEYGQCVHRVAGHPDRPDQLFLQNHLGVYRSDDGGGSWQSIAAGLPADFGFPVVVHPHRPDTAYLFPLQSDGDRMPPDRRFRVYRTDDAGRTWTPLTDGLPDGPYHAAVLRDAMCTDSDDPAGIYVGTRAGELYASADDGERWQLVVEHLPDVLSVRALTV
jgi:photosystem II stability/assembly factor-like uncharacterized protein